MADQRGSLRQRRQRAAILALLFGAFYFLTEGISVLFHEGRPYLKFMKHVDLDFPIHWFFELPRTLGLYNLPITMGYNWGREENIHAVARGTLVYMAMGYLLGFILKPSTKLSKNPTLTDCIPRQGSV